VVPEEPSSLTLIPGGGAEVRPTPDLAADSAIEVDALHRSYGRHIALRGVSLEVPPGQIHALLGPNGAGKTTLLRVILGLATPTGGAVRVLGLNGALHPAALKHHVGFVPSGDRSFYQRLSGLENLVFFARLRGLRRRAALERAWELLAEVGLADAARREVGRYSHGMQKRLSIARALLVAPPVLLVDEATHDLDPPGAELVRELIRELASRQTAVLWATQRVDEIRGFADRVTFLADGQVRFAGSVESLLSYGQAGRYVLRLAMAVDGAHPAAELLDQVLGAHGCIRPLPDGHVALETPPGVSLGAAIARLQAAGVAVIDCGRERSEVEAAFHALLAREAA
jgi:ABC-2 type transport system ATP-binding protein